MVRRDGIVYMTPEQITALAASLKLLLRCRVRRREGNRSDIGVVVGWGTWNGRNNDRADGRLLVCWPSGRRSRIAVERVEVVD